MKRLVFAGCLTLLLAGTALAEEEGGSVERGKALFEDTKLGTTGNSCASCHPGGRKLEWAATFNEEKLASIVNNCIKNSLKGKPLATGSDDMKSLVRYIKTFAGP